MFKKRKPNNRSVRTRYILFKKPKQFRPRAYKKTTVPGFPPVFTVTRESERTGNETQVKYTVRDWKGRILAEYDNRSNAAEFARRKREAAIIKHKAQVEAAKFAIGQKRYMANLPKRLERAAEKDEKTRTRTIKILGKKVK